MSKILMTYQNSKKLLYFMVGNFINIQTDWKTDSLRNVRQNIEHYGEKSRKYAKTICDNNCKEQKFYPHSAAKELRLGHLYYLKFSFAYQNGHFISVAA